MIPAQTINNEQLSDLRHEIETTLTELYIIRCLAKDCPDILGKISRMSERLIAAIETPVDIRLKAPDAANWLQKIDECKAWLYSEDTHASDFKARMDARLHLCFSQEGISKMLQLQVIVGGRKRKRGRPKKTKLVMVK
jgi:hypothetical protein